ncbi:uncharacterized protein LOC121420637 [Lytechinus variegatus]|uniref:uncharacterized protein LOC121420637 n=1 Tax=Lytechinus variegatus TaxID=7654 RepID=UPI001BB162D8|nr:uncharacterized protein LOC121420637 [Lytechinus variegatus]
MCPGNCPPTCHCSFKWVWILYIVAAGGFSVVAFEVIIYFIVKRKKTKKSAELQLTQTYSTCQDSQDIRSNKGRASTTDNLTGSNIQCDETDHTYEAAVGGSDAPSFYMALNPPDTGEPSPATRQDASNPNCSSADDYDDVALPERV